MRKSLGFVVLMVGLLTMVSLFGCGQQTTPAPSPGSSDSAAKAGAAAIDAVKAEIGVAEISSSMGALTGAMPTGFSVKSLSFLTRPDAFFKPVSADGWITVEGVSLVTGETVQIRLYTVGGQVIDSSYLARKKLLRLRHSEEN